MADAVDETKDLQFPDPDGHPHPTTPLPAPASTQGSRVALIFLAAAAGAFLLGIAVATASRPEPAQEVLARADVGPSGGVVRFEGGEVRIPEGALAEPRQIVVLSSVYDDRVRVEAEDGPLVFEAGRLSAYTFEPADVSFQAPVQITFRLPPGSSNGTVFARRGSTIVLLQGTVDPARATATVEVTDLRFGGDRR